MEGHLGARANHQPVIFIEIGDAYMRFQMNMLLFLRMVFPLKNMIRFREGFIHIAYFCFDVIYDIMFTIVNAFCIRFIMNHRRAILHGFFHIHYRR